MRAQASEHYPLEACGLLLGRPQGGGVRIARVVPCANVAEPSRRGHCFMIDPREMFGPGRRVGAHGDGFVGFFHSHPDAAARPSGPDMDSMRLWPGTAWLILPVFGGRVAAPRAWWLESPHDERARELPVRVVPTAAPPAGPFSGLLEWAAEDIIPASVQDEMGDADDPEPDAS